MNTVHRTIEVGNFLGLDDAQHGVKRGSGARNLSENLELPAIGPFLPSVLRASCSAQAPA